MLFVGLLIVATVLVALVAGLVFAFAVVVMPGIGRLDDAGFVRAFQAVDGVIQSGDARFMLAWLGSAVALVAAAVWGLWALHGVDRALLVAAAVVYVAGVQAPTAVVNVPMNNALQRVDVAAASPAQLAEARGRFEGRWNRWNQARTVVAVVTLVGLLVVLARVGTAV